MDIIFIDTLIKLDRLNVHTMRQKNTMEKYFFTKDPLQMLAMKNNTIVIRIRY